jgi:pimeloyl-ACP methyl ester carboxylesterase
MTRAGWFLWVALAATLAGGCKESLHSNPDGPITTIAMFDPAAGIIPLPNDIAKATTGKLPTTAEVTLADGTKRTLATFPPPMKEFVDNYLNLAPGFPVEQPLSIKFSCDIDVTTNLCRNGVDPTTLAGDSIRVYDVTEVRAALALTDATARATALAAATVTRVAGLAASPAVQTTTYTEDAILLPPSTYLESAAAAAQPWQPGRTYFAVVTTGVKDLQGTPISVSQVFAYLKSRTPLATCTRDAAGVIQVNPQGVPLCTADVFLSDNQTEAIALAVQLEAVRQSLAPFLDKFEGLPSDALPRSDVAVAWTFTTWPVQVMLDATNGVIPLPNNLVRASPNGPIAIPTTKTLADGTVVDVFPPAQKAFIDTYLNTLDGFPQLQPISLPFDGPAVDPASLAGPAVRVFDITALLAEFAKATPDLASVPLTEVTGLSYGADLLEYATAGGLPVAQASIRPPTPWAPGHTFLAVATSALKGTAGTPVLPPFVFGFAKVTTSLVMEDGTPLIPASKADAAQLEALRLGMAPLLTWLAALPAGVAIPRADVALAWTFTTSAANEALFDPTAGLLPFPNDVLIDQTTGKVALPIAPTEPAALQALKGGLNTLDGFGNNGPATTAFSLPLDPATVTLIPDLTGVLTLSNPIGVADITTVDPSDPDTLVNLVVLGPDQVDVRYDQGQLVVQNKSGQPLPPNHRYMIIMFDSLMSAGTDPLPIHVSPVFWLARNELPLVDQAGKSQLPSTLSDADALQLEGLRQAYMGIFDALAGLGIGREKVLGFFTFTTATTTADLQGLASLLPAPTSVSAGTFETVADAGADWAGVPAAAIEKVCVGCSMGTRSVLAPPDLTDPANPKLGYFQVDAQGAPVLTPRTLPFELVLPTGDGPFPIVVFQHGIDGTRHSIARIANDLAAVGLASFAIDLPMHGDHPIRFPGAPTGTGFFSADVFAVRDNMRQGAMDQAQAIKFLRTVLAPALEPEDAALLDTTKVYFLGESLGAMVGTLTAGLVPDLAKVALVVPGGHIVRIFTETARQSFKQPLLDALAALGIAPGTPAFLQFLMLAQWALDRADPVNWALVAKGATPATRFRIVEAAGDDFMPNGATEALALALGIPKATSPAFKAFAAGTAATATICHGFFLWGCDAADYPALDQAEVAVAQTAARTFIIDFLKD